ncbi:peptidyl-prolyl cis-trans isomerase G-like [Phymastichus coffea]|uniref:peptidyl-prolyl cis-trans isomerase G-like n=1 Tax=Phymastichus coffea TaxID=108790 RepID=UPI00273AA01B|nr:peptidyl-prolyl cis-trans isomerase G-like [Phymastichus coffea]
MVKDEKKMDKPVIFDPPIRPRFLPGEVDSVVNRIDFKCYQAHRLSCANAKPKVDNKPPKFDTSIYYDTENLKDDARLTKAVHLQNLQLAKALNKVYRLGGKVDCWNLRDKKYQIDQTEEIKMCKRIMKDNKKLYRTVNCLLVGEYAPKVHAKAWQALKEQIEEKQRFPWLKEPFRYPSITINAVPPEHNDGPQRSVCFFDLALGNLPLGRVVFELYNDYVPSICANFEAFCKGYERMSYKGTPFHRIVSDYWCQGGDVTKFNGLGGASIHDGAPNEDNYTLEHSCPGVLSTYNDRQDGFDSKFNLTFQPLKTMNGRKVVFGKVVKGMDNVLKINAYGTKFGKPLRQITVCNCGVLQPKKKVWLRSSVECEPTGSLSSRSENAGDE